LLGKKGYVVVVVVVFDSAARSAAQVESVFSACLDELKLSAKL